MTVGIGLLCERGNKILLSADMRASYGVSRNDQAGKIFDLPFNFYGAIAGHMGWCGEVISEIHWRMGKIEKSELGAIKIRETIIDSYHAVGLMLADQELRNVLKITIKQFQYDKKLAPRILSAATEIIQQINFDVDLIVAGFIESGPIQFVAQGGTSIKVHPEISPGNAVIGTGAVAALNWLSYRKQNYALGLAHSLLHMTEAKQFAEVDQNVGPLRQMVLLYPGGSKPLEGGQDLLQQWWLKYGLPLSTGMEDDKFNRELERVFNVNFPK